MKSNDIQKEIASMNAAVSGKDKSQSKPASGNPPAQEPKAKQPTKKALVLAYMIDNGSITQEEAREHCKRCWRLSAIVHDLRKNHRLHIITIDEKHERGIHARYLLANREAANDCLKSLTAS